MVTHSDTLFAQSSQITPYDLMHEGWKTLVKNNAVPAIQKYTLYIVCMKDILALRNLSVNSPRDERHLILD
ncbi:hypothetical protein CNR22_11850 [Sphingobacteriaceae bacterium]|nr:hypothetical protein CNR22_11850 [Sphingobacteriaceae bacterium]